jgi:hypothetical protein
LIFVGQGADGSIHEGDWAQLRVAKKSDYTQICQELGFRSDAAFVKIENGEISFTGGRPEDVKALACRAAEAGYRMSESLAFRAER